MTVAQVRSVAILSLLSVILLVTRFAHFGTLWNPPDATLAMLFLAGWYIAGWHALAILLALAGIADAISIAGGVSAWCVTPAYWFLIPAYAALWAGGRWASGISGSLLWRCGGTALALLASVTVFFAISNASFYLLSGYFGSMPGADFARAVIQYFPYYLQVTVAYVLAGALVDRAVRLLLARHPPLTGRQTARG